MTTPSDKLGFRECLHGHPLTPDNLNARGRCATCGRNQSRATRRRKQLALQLKRREDSDIAAGKIDYLYLTPEQQEASDRLTEGIDKNKLAGKLRCQTTQLVHDIERNRIIEVYPHTDYDERTPPTVLEAARLCHGCPVMAMCYEYANTIKPSVGVFGGVVWIDGEPQTH